MKICVLTSHGSAVPIFHRSKLFPAISHKSPSILLDVVGNDREKSIFFSIYHTTHRYNPLSSWLEKLQSFFADLESKEKRKEGLETTPADSSLTRVRHNLNVLHPLATFVSDVYCCEIARFLYPLLIAISITLLPSTSKRRHVQSFEWGTYAFPAT